MVETSCQHLFRAFAACDLSIQIKIVRRIKKGTAKFLPENFVHNVTKF